MGLSLNKILKEQIQEISLSKRETAEIENLTKEIIKKISSVKKDLNMNVRIGGSLAKETLIKKDIQDIDIFVIFNSEEETKKLEEVIKSSKIKEKNILKKIHGSRDYFQISQNLAQDRKIIFEIIPVVSFSKSEKVKNITDFSLMHVGYIKNKLKKNKKLADEIKLAKSFCFANDCYGAESYIKGFSGYTLEVLVCYFGSFVKFLKESRKKRIIDPEKYFKSEPQILKELNESKLQSPIILIDPVYKYRNVCAGLSAETFDRFLNASKKFLSSPNLSFFEKKEFNEDRVRKFAENKKAEFLKIRFKTFSQEGDIAGTKMKKFFEFLCRNFKEKQQKVLVKEFFYKGEGQEAIGYLVIKENKEIEIRGPAENMRDAVKNFKRARKKTYLKNRYFYAKEKISLENIFAHIKQFEEDMNVQFELFD